MTRISYRCPKCGSDNVGHDGVAKWNDDTQAFDIAQAHDQRWCNDCGDIDEFAEVKLPPKPAREFHQLLVLSTSHLTEETAEGLVAGSAFVPVSVKLDEYGFFLSTLPARQDLARNAVPADLMACLKKGDELGCGYVLFDRDAAVIDDLPAYDW